MIDQVPVGEPLSKSHFVRVSPDQDPIKPFFLLYALRAILPADAPQYRACMCGRYTRHYTWEQVRDFLDLRFPDELGLREAYNVAPTHRAPIVRLRGKDREMSLAAWGLVPAWATDPGVGVKMFNARSETVAEKPAYREAYRKRRCVVPVSGFYEWPKRSHPKTPHYFSRADEQIMCLAGLWERWDRGEGALETFTVITTDANETVSPIHPRMPVVLEPDAIGVWLGAGGAPDEARALLRPAAPGVIQSWPVASFVGDVRRDGPELIEPQQPDRGLFDAL
ncbi:MAG: SOS response-associated peptidase [Phycisphaerales bacterium JB059]